MEFIQNQSFQGTTSSKSKNYWKLVLSGPVHTPKWKLYKTIFWVILSYQLDKLCLPGDLNKCAEASLYVLCKTISQVCLYVLCKTISQVCLFYWLNELCLLENLNICAEASLCHHQTASSRPCFEYNSTYFDETCFPGGMNECVEASLYALHKTGFQVSLSYWH